MAEGDLRDYFIGIHENQIAGAEETIAYFKGNLETLERNGGIDFDDAEYTLSFDPCSDGIRKVSREHKGTLADAFLSLEDDFLKRNPDHGERLLNECIFAFYEVEVRIGGRLMGIPPKYWQDFTRAARERKEETVEVQGE
jgi:hypothetical protein